MRRFLVSTLCACSFLQAASLRGPTTAEKNVTLVTADKPVLVSGAVTSTATTNDLLMDNYTTATYDMNKVLSTTVVGLQDTPVITALDPTIMSADGLRVSNGIARFQVVCDGITKQYSIFSYRYGGATTSIFNSYVPTALAPAAITAVDALLPDKTGVVAISGNQWVPTHFAYSLDMTGVSITSPRVVAISKRFVIGAEHYTCGNPVQFLTRGNVVVSRTVVTKVDIGPANSADVYATDSYLGLLDSDLPATITPMEILPSVISTYIPSLSSLYKLPVIAWRQGNRVGLCDLVAAATSVSTNVPTGARAAFYESKVSGDSSNPAFLVVNGTPALVTEWTWGGAGGGPKISSYDLTTLMTTMSGTSYRAGVDVPAYTDLTGFPSY